MRVKKKMYVREAPEKKIPPVFVEALPPSSNETYMGVLPTVTETFELITQTLVFLLWYWLALLK